jgi:hypothetical protein
MLQRLGQLCRDLAHFREHASRVRKLEMRVVRPKAAPEQGPHLSQPTAFRTFERLLKTERLSAVRAQRRFRFRQRIQVHPQGVRPAIDQQVHFAALPIRHQSPNYGVSYDSVGMNDAVNVTTSSIPISPIWNWDT